MSDSNWYSTTFKVWQVKHVGSKPTAELLANIHNLGARPGKQAMACAMALRDEGVTNAQIIQVCGAPQLNKMRGFITDGLLKRVPVAPNALGHSVYKLELTAKGTKRIESAVKRAAEAAAKGDDATAAKPKKAAAKGAAKPKGAAKRKGATKAAPATQAPSDAPAVTDQAPAVHVDGAADQPQT